jgi:hypothetical protein
MCCLSFSGAQPRRVAALDGRGTPRGSSRAKGLADLALRITKRIFIPRRVPSLGGTALTRDPPKEEKRAGRGGGTGEGPDYVSGEEGGDGDEVRDMDQEGRWRGRGEVARRLYDVPSNCRHPTRAC